MQKTEALNLKANKDVYMARIKWTVGKWQINNLMIILPQNKNKIKKLK